MKDNDESNLEEIVSETSSTSTLDDKNDESHDEAEHSISSEVDYQEVSVDADDNLVETIEDSDTVESLEYDDDNMSDSVIEPVSNTESISNSQQSTAPQESSYLEDELMDKKPNNVARIFVIMIVIALLVLSSGLMTVFGMFTTNSNDLPSASDSLMRVYDVSNDLVKDNSQQLSFTLKGLGIDILADIQFDSKAQKGAMDLDMTVLGESTKMNAYMVNYDPNNLGKTVLAFNIMNEIEVVSLSDSEFSELLEEWPVAQYDQDSDLLEMIQKNSKDIDKLFNVSQKANNYVYSMKEPLVIKQSDLAKNKEYQELATTLSELGLGSFDLTVDISFSTDIDNGYISNLELSLSIIGGMTYTATIDQDLTSNVSIDIPKEIQAAIDDYKK